MGVSRTIDDLGRIVIPKEMRELLGVKEGTTFDISCENGVITLKKIETSKDAEYHIKALKGIVVNTRFKYPLQGEALEHLEVVRKMIASYIYGENDEEEDG